MNIKLLGDVGMLLDYYGFKGWAKIYETEVSIDNCTLTLKYEFDPKRMPLDKFSYYLTRCIANSEYSNWLKDKHKLELDKLRCEIAKLKYEKNNMGIK
jgi:hypothetical protein